jgi:hypothetical protein
MKSCSKGEHPRTVDAEECRIELITSSGILSKLLQTKTKSMHLKKCLSLVICLLAYLAVPAASVPARFAKPVLLGDTTLTQQALTEKAPLVINKKPGFFARLKQKVLVYAFRKSLPNEQENKTKIALGYIGLALLALAIPIGLIASSGALFLGGAAAGLLASLVSVLMPGSNKKNVAGKVGLVIGGAVLVLFIIAAIAFAGGRWG